MINQLILLLMLSLAVSQLADAQPYLGLGTNFSSIYESDLHLDHSSNSNPIFTLGHQFFKKSKIKTSTELQYSVKGFKIKGATITVEGDPNGSGQVFLPTANSNLRIHYLDFVPTIEFPFIKQMNIVLGANGALKLFDTFNDIQLQEFKMKPHKTFDYGWVAGAKLSYKQYWIRAIFNKGLTNISAADNHYKNFNFQIVLGFTLNDNHLPER